MISSLTELAPGCYVWRLNDGPNTGVVIGNRGVAVIDTQATPALAREVLAQIRYLTDQPIRYLILSHYHATQALGASAYDAETVIASRATFEWIKERGHENKACEIGRAPHFFPGADEIPGLTWPNLIFGGELTLCLGNIDLRIFTPGRGHTKGDTVVWVPKRKVLYAGDLVEVNTTPDCGDAYLMDWPVTLGQLAQLHPEQLVPGHGVPLVGEAACQRTIAQTKSFLRTLYDSVSARYALGQSLRTTHDEAAAVLRTHYGHWALFDQCLPFNVSRAYDEASGIHDPRIWTDLRDREISAYLNGE